MLPRIAHLRTPFIAAAIGGALLIGGAASAKVTTSAPDADGRVQRTTEVQYGDLDLTTEAGAATLETRMRGAVRSVCAPAPRGTFADSLDYQRCMTDASDASHRAMVTLIARARSGEDFAENASLRFGD